MAQGFNQVNLLGNLTADPETQRLYLRVSLSAHLAWQLTVSWTGKDGNKQEEVNFFDCVAWGKPGEIIAQYMGKGRQLFVSGRLQNRSWEAKDGSKRYTEQK
jgi:single-strand DNA-binding protein